MHHAESRWIYLLLSGPVVSSGEWPAPVSTFWCEQNCLKLEVTRLLLPGGMECLQCSYELIDRGGQNRG